MIALGMIALGMIALVIARSLMRLEAMRPDPCAWGLMS